MAELYEDVKSTRVYNSGHLMENDFMGRTPWAGSNGSSKLESNAPRRKKQKLDSVRRKGNGRKRMQ